MLYPSFSLHFQNLRMDFLVIVSMSFLLAQQEIRVILPVVFLTAKGN